MKKYILLFTILFFITFIIYSQPPPMQWEKALGGTGDELSTSIQQTIDGGYIIAGYSTSNDADVSGNHGGIDFWIVKMDSLGIIQWQKSLGGTGDDHANSIQQTADGGYIIAGYSNSNDGDVLGNHGGKDFWVVKIDGFGIIQWQKSLGGTADDLAYSIYQTTDAGFIVAGYSLSNNGDVTGNHGSQDYWIVKLNNVGIIQWQKSFGGTKYENALSVIQTADGGYIVVGFSASIDGDVVGNHGGSIGYDCWVLKLDNGGTIQWQKSIGGTGTDYGYSVLQTTDGGYVVSGYSSSVNGDMFGNHSSGDCIVIKLSSSGNFLWKSFLGGTGAEGGSCIQKTNDGGYIVTGYSNSADGDLTENHGNMDCWIVKLDNVGTILWQKSFGGMNRDTGKFIQQTTDGGYIVAGESASSDGDITGNHGGIDCWIIKLSSFVSVKEIKSVETTVHIFPNPSTGLFNFTGLSKENTIEIYDITGQLIYKAISVNDNAIINLSGHTEGLYLYRITDEKNQVSQGKIIIQ